MEKREILETFDFQFGKGEHTSGLGMLESAN